MATFRNNRRRLVQTVNPHQNAEGVIPLSFSGLQLHKLYASDQLNRRNELPQAKFTLIDPTNGKTIGVMVQCQLRDDILEAFKLKDEGHTIIVKNVYGPRARADVFDGKTTMFAEKMTIDWPSGEEIEQRASLIALAEGIGPLPRFEDVGPQLVSEAVN